MDANMNRPTLTSVYMGRKAEPAKGKDGRAWEYYAWRLTLAHEGREMSFDYRAELGHCKMRPANLWGMPKDARLIYNAFGPGRDGWETPKAPTLFDALYCQCMDAQGYDSARDLRRVLGHVLYAKLTAMDEDALRAWCEASPSPEAAR